MQLHAARPRHPSLISSCNCNRSASPWPCTCRVYSRSPSPHSACRAASEKQQSAYITSSPNDVDRGAAADSIAVPQILRRVAFSVSDLDLRGLRGLIDSSSGSNCISTVCNVADSLIGTFFGPETLKPSNDPAIQLSGNYAPVPETPPQQCTHIDGTIPSDLNGIYIRNGPNPTRLFEREGYHMFDGDGMLHGIRLQTGTASYCSRYVRTSRFVQEELAGRPLFLKFFGGFYGFIGFARAGILLVRAVLGVLNMREGWGLSNTSVCYFNGRVLSLSEDDMPYVIRVTNEGDLITMGRLQYAHTLPSRNMCAHPKFDPATGEMFAYSFRPSLKFPYSFYKVPSNGIKSKEVTIPIKEISFMHDFAITQNYAIFPDNQFVIRPWKFLRGEMPVICDKKKTPRFCVMRRDATTQSGAPRTQWFEAPDCNGYHYINAWEEGDEVVIITPIISPPEHFLDIPAQYINCHLTEVRLNLVDGSTSTKRLCNENLEFGTFNLNYTGRKMRYAYLAVGNYPKLSGIVKIDLEANSLGENSCIVARRDFGEKCHGNEPFFVPSSTQSSMKESLDGPRALQGFVRNYTNNVQYNYIESKEEDEGYVVCLVHNISTRTSHFLIMDAQSPSLEVLASIKLPSRVPYGFHGFFVHENDLAKQGVNFL